MRKIVTILSLLFIIIFSSSSFSQTFTRIDTGSVAQDLDHSQGSCWGDFDNDGYEDLLITNGWGGLATHQVFLYHNEGNGKFSKVLSGDWQNQYADYGGACFGDYDNDGDLDIFIPVYQSYNYLYRNEGNSNFKRVSDPIISLDRQTSVSSSWIDFDNDGFLDLLVFNSERNQLFHNEADGSFALVPSEEIAVPKYNSCCGSWSDFDNDGDMDLFVATVNNGKNYLFVNKSNESFASLENGSIVNNTRESLSACWGDIDNDGDMDLFVVNGFGDKVELHRNNGDGTFEEITTEPLITENTTNVSGSWGDFDNDGDLDLFVTGDNSPGYSGKNYLYANDGSGNFTTVEAGQIVKDRGAGCSICDYDKDGDLDIFVVNFKWNSYKNIFYVNNGNENNWINVKLRGKVSNTTSIGAKVRVKAIINKKSVWQLREIAQQNTYCGHHSMSAHFGLGDATKIDSLKIEWPSGITQVQTDIPINQFIEISEPFAHQNDLSILPTINRHPQGTVFATTTPKISIRNIGALDALNAKIICQINQTGELISSTEQNMSNLPSLAVNKLFFKDAILYEPGDYDLFYFIQSNNDENASNDTLKMRFNISNLIDDFENRLDKWHSNSTWGVTTQFADSGKYSLNDSPNDKYQNNADSWVEFNYSFDLSKISSAYLAFSTTHFLEQDKDFGCVEVSKDDGLNWEQVGDRYTGIDWNWKKVGHDLSNFCGAGFTNVRFRFHLTSDGANNLAGWYIDNVTIQEGEFISSVQDFRKDCLPQKYALFDCYPNPFNSETVIRYVLPTAGHVKLTICNSIGQEIFTLADEFQQSGRHYSKWNGKDKMGFSVPSGLYFYRLEVNDFVECKKTVLLK